MSKSGRRKRHLQQWAHHVMAHPEEWLPSAEAMERALTGTACAHGLGPALECRECGARVLSRQTCEALYERLGTTPEVARRLAAEVDARHYGPPAAAN